MPPTFSQAVLILKTLLEKMALLTIEKDLFLQNKELQATIVQYLLEISRACHQLPQDIKNAAPYISWARIQNFHTTQDPDILYEITTQELPQLRTELQEMMLQLELLRKNILQIKSNLNITVSPEIQLRQMNLDFTKTFFSSIHQHSSATDEYRMRLQKKYDSIESVQKRISAGLSEKFLVDGTPDFFIFYQEQLIGMFEFHPITKPKQVEIGYWLYEEYRRKRILSLIMPKMIDYAQTHLNILKIRATTRVENIPSQKLLEKFGFCLTDTIEYQVKGKPIRELEYFYVLKDSISQLPEPEKKLPRRMPSFPLPAYRFVPKLHPHPIKHPKGHMFGKENLWNSMSDNERWSIGIDLFNNNYFWEAHEIWEGLWKEKQGTEKDFLQAMILLSASLLQEHLHRTEIARKSVHRAKELLKDIDPWSQKYQLDVFGLMEEFFNRNIGQPYPKITIKAP